MLCHTIEVKEVTHMNNYTIGQYIQSLRKKQGLTQKELGDRLGISFQAVSKWENGETLPDTGILLALADILETTTDKILSAGQLIIKTNKFIDISKIKEGLHRLYSLKSYFGETNEIYQSAIEGVNKRLNIDFESRMSDDDAFEELLAEIVIHYLMDGFSIDIEDVKKHIRSRKLRNIVKKYIGDDEDMDKLREYERPELFHQIRAIRDEFKDVSILYLLPGDYIRMDTKKDYWCTQIECSDHCLGIAVDEKHIYVFSYQENGVNQTLVHTESIKQ